MRSKKRRLYIDCHITLQSSSSYFRLNKGSPLKTHEKNSCTRKILYCSRVLQNHTSLKNTRKIGSTFFHTNFNLDFALHFSKTHFSLFSTLRFISILIASKTH